MIQIIKLVVLTLILGVSLYGCIPAKKVKEQLALAEARTNTVRDSLLNMRVKADSLNADLLKTQGGNELLLVAHRQLQDRLLELDDEIERLNGTLNNTQNNLQQQLQNSSAEKQQVTKELEALRQRYRNISNDYQEKLAGVSEQIALDSLLSDKAILRSRAGSVSVMIAAKNLFQKGSSTRLKKDANELLAPLAAILDQSPLLELMIIGHTDNKTRYASQGGSRAFSARQSVTLANVFAKQFYLSANRITASGMGDAAPMQSNATKEGREANQRIEFRFTNNVVNLLRELEKAGKTEENR